MSATIRETNAFTDAWNTIFAKINSISDPDSKSKWVYSAFPERAIEDKDAYPLIIIEPVEFAYDPLTLKTIKRGPMRVSIDLYSTEASELDSVSDSIANTMETEENNGNFTMSGIDSMRLVSSAYTQFSRNGLRVHNKTFNYEFDFGWF